MPDIRPIEGPTLLDAAYVLHSQAFSPKNPDFLTPEGFKTLAGGKNAVLLGAFGADRALAGYLLYRKIFPEAEVLSLAVAPNSRKTGFGRALITAMLEDLEFGRFSAVFLEVGEANAAARTLYRAFGAVETGVRKNYYKTPEGAPENALLKKINLR